MYIRAYDMLRVSKTQQTISLDTQKTFPNFAKTAKLRQLLNSLIWYTPQNMFEKKFYQKGEVCAMFETFYLEEGNPVHTFILTKYSPKLLGYDTYRF